MKKIWPWIFGILFGLILIAWLFAGRSDRQAYRAARGANPEATQPPPTTGDCALLAQSPANGTLVAPDAGFTASWQLQNTGSEKWSSGEVDIRYIGAQSNISLHQGENTYDLPTDVSPGASFTFSVAMLAPSDPGAYGERWELAVGKKQLCEFYLDIGVK